MYATNSDTTAWIIEAIHTGDTMEADNPIDNIMCQDILINVIFDCES